MAFVVCGAVLAVLALRGAPADAACATGDGQLRCAFEGVAVELGRPAVAEHGTGFVLGVAGPADVPLAPQEPPTWLTIFLQRSTNDPSNCHRVGNETFCY